MNYFTSIGKNIEVIDAARPLEDVFSDFKEKIS